MPTILITGGTGLIGTALSKLFTERQYDVIILTRQPRAAASNISYAAWDPAQGTIDTAAIQKADYIINLAGAGIADKRWTKNRKAEIANSRIQSGQLLVRALQETPNKVKAVISASGIGWYGDDENRNPQKPLFTEEDPADDGYLGTTCVQWENSVQPVTSLGKRLVIFRKGPVFSTAGGAYKEFAKPVRYGLATILGDGRQVVSWIHIDDVCRLYLYAIENENMQGVYNAVAPEPVTNKNLMLTMAKKMKGSFFIPFYVPSFLLKIVVGEVSVEVLKSASVSCEKIRATGFQFVYPSLDVALDDLVKK